MTMPVWDLSGIAKRFSIAEARLRCDPSALAGILLPIVADFKA
jgi:hypothetical protein